MNGGGWPAFICRLFRLSPPWGTQIATARARRERDRAVQSKSFAIRVAAAVRIGVRIVAAGEIKTCAPMREAALSVAPDVVVRAMRDPEHAAVFVQHESRTTRVGRRICHGLEMRERHGIARTALRNIRTLQRSQRSTLDDGSPIRVLRQTTKQILRAAFAGAHVHQMKTELALAEGPGLPKPCNLDRITPQPVLDVRPIRHAPAAIAPNDPERISSGLEFGQHAEAHRVLPLLEALSDRARGIVFLLHLDPVFRRRID